MKLTRIQLSNFRNHQQSDTALDRLTCIRGANHSGKSTIAQAIEFALTGRCDSTDMRGEGATSLIRHGADKAVISLSLQGARDIVLRCALTEKSGRQPLTVKDPSDLAYTGEAFLGWLAAQKPVLSCLLNTRHFISLDAGEQKKLLASIILPSHYEWPTKIIDAIMAAGMGGHILATESAVRENNGVLSPFEFIERAYSACYDRRRDLNRDLKAIYIPEPLPKGDASTTSEVNQQLADLRAQQHQLRQAERKKSGERTDLQSKIARLEERIKGLTAKAAAEDAKLQQLDKVLLTDKQIKKLKEAAAKQAQADAYEQELTIIREGMSANRGVLAIFEGLDGKDACPLCQRPVDTAFLMDAMKPHVEQQDALMGKERDTLKLLAELGNPSGAAGQIEQNAKDVADHNRSRSILAETTATERTLKDELEQLQGKLSALPAEGAQDDPFAQPIATLESQMSAVAAYEQRQKDIEAAKERRSKLEASVKALDELAAYFGKDGIKAELLKQHIGEFISEMNKVLKQWHYMCDLQVEPYEFYVGWMDEEGDSMRPLDVLSGSERLRFAVAFQVALAIVSGIKMIVVDEVDILDSSGRSAFYEMLLSSDLDQAIAIGTSELREAPSIPGAVFYAIDNGQPVLLGAESLAVVA